jgi:hypothetical protein
VLAVSVFLGIGLNFKPLDPIKGALLERGRKRRARAPGHGAPDAIGARLQRTFRPGNHAHQQSHGCARARSHW